MSPTLLAPGLAPSIADLIADRPALSMHAHDGLLLEGVPLAAIGRAVGTPAWVMSAGTLRTRLAALQDAFAPLRAHVHYAVKANDHLAVLGIMRAGGAGADVVSQGELRRARQAGFAPAQIVYSGVGKTPADLEAAITADIAQINVESAEELLMLAAAAARLGRSARVALRINPDIDAGTHAKITTGRADNKFGIALADIPALYAQIATLPGLAAGRPGAAYRQPDRRHGALPRRLRPRRRDDRHPARPRPARCTRWIAAAAWASATATRPPAPPTAFAGAVGQAFGGMGLQLMIEPGRWLAGPAGLLLASVVLTKTTGRHRFLVLDAAMNDLVRPAMYDAWHGIVPLSPFDARAPCQPMSTWSARSARPGTPLRAAGRCRPSPPIPWWRSWTRVRMVRS